MTIVSQKSKIEVNPMRIIDTVKLVLRDTLQLGERVASFDAETPLFGSLPELDSMAVVSVVTALEERFGFEIEDDEITAETFETVGSLSAFVAGKLDA
jgi:acyl carrier protein